MPELLLPRLRPKPRREAKNRNCAGHRAWVRRHGCSVRSCNRGPVHCAHVRMGTDGGVGMKPSDRWTISLCDLHHREQHNIGETAFQAKYDLDLLALAKEFAVRSPFRHHILPRR